MAVGQIVGCLGCDFPLGDAQGYVVYGRWPNCGRAAVSLGAHVRRAIFDKTVVGRCRGKRSFDPGCSPDYGFCFRRRESVFVAELCGFFAIHQIPSEFVICRPPAAFL